MSRWEDVTLVAIISLILLILAWVASLAVRSDPITPDTIPTSVYQHPETTP